MPVIKWTKQVFCVSLNMPLCDPQVGPTHSLKTPGLHENTETGVSKNKKKVFKKVRFQWSGNTFACGKSCGFENTCVRFC